MDKLQVKFFSVFALGRFRLKHSVKVGVSRDLTSREFERWLESFFLLANWSTANSKLSSRTSLTSKAVIRMISEQSLHMYWGQSLILVIDSVLGSF